MSKNRDDWENIPFGDADQGFMHSEGSHATAFSTNESAPAEPIAVEQRQKKKKGPLFWFGTLSAGVLLVACIGGGLYWLTRPTIEEQAFLSDVSPVVVPKNNIVPNTQPTNVPDTNVKHDEDAIAALHGKETNLERSSDQAKPSEPEVIEKKKSSLPSPATRNPPKSNHAKPLDDSPSSSKNKAEQPVVSEKTIAEYVVQVFSSPSRDDATEWLEVLRKRNISDGYITEQKIRGDSWYRVRFGSFSTRAAAETEATRYGFRQPWIARIR